MKAQSVLFFTLLGILMVYASEMSFMPNYVSRPDKWHLLLPMLLFGVLLLLQLIWRAFIMIKNKKMEWAYIALMALCLLGFAQLNHPKGDWQEVGYAGLSVIAIMLAGSDIFNRLKRNRRLSDQSA